MDSNERRARMAEAYRRGIMPADIVPRFEEAARRGLVPELQAGSLAGQPQPQPQTQQQPPRDLSLGRTAGLVGRAALGVTNILDLGNLIPAPASWSSEEYRDPRFRASGNEAAAEKLITPGDSGSTSERVADFIGLPSPETDAQRRAVAFGSGVAGYLPFFAGGAALKGVQGAGRLARFARGAGNVLTTAPVVQGVAGGLGKVAANEVGMKGGTPWQQVGAEIGVNVALPSANTAVRAAGRGLSAGLRGAAGLLTQGGANRTAAYGLRQFASDPAALERALTANIPGAELVPGSLPTTAQVVGDRGLGTLEKALSNNGEVGREIAERFITQDEARQAALGNVYDVARARLAQAEEIALARAQSMNPNVSPDVLGGTIRDARQSLDETFRAQRTTPAYAAVDPQGATRFDVQPLRQQAQEIANRYLQGVIEPGTELQRLARALGRTDVATTAQMQALRSVADEAAFQAGRSGLRQDAAIAGQVKRAIDDTMLDGLSAEGRNAQEKATALWRELNESFRSGPNEALYSDALRGSQGTANSAIPELFFQKGAKGIESARTFMRGVGNSPEALRAIQDFAVQSALETSTKSGKLSASSLRTWIQDYKGALDEIPGVRNALQDLLAQQQRVDAAGESLRAVKELDSGTFTLSNRAIRHGALTNSDAFLPDEVQRVLNVQADIARARDVSRAGRAAGSDTVKNLGLRSALQSAGLGGRSGNALQSALGSLYGKAAGITGATGRTTEALSRAMLDPQEALRLLLQYPQQGQRALQGVALPGAAIRGVVDGVTEDNRYGGLFGKL